MTNADPTSEDFFARECQQLENVKAQLIGALTPLGVSTVVVVYDNDGDRIESVSAEAIGGGLIDLARPAPNSISEASDEPGETRTSMDNCA
jgi:hypothetical protein